MCGVLEIRSTSTDAAIPAASFQVRISLVRYSSDTMLNFSIETLIRFCVYEYMIITDNYTLSIAEAQEITQPNRYLMIATSGGLNQQRTGVVLSTLVIVIIEKQGFDIWLFFSIKCEMNSKNGERKIHMLRQSDFSVD